MSWPPHIKCPHCGQKIIPELDLYGVNEADDKMIDDVLCGGCGLYFICITEVKTTRRAARIEGEEPRDGC